jgi:hypothetical protein
MLRRSSRAILLSSILLAAASGNWNDTSTGIDLNKLSQFPLTKVRSGWLQAGSRIKFDGITAGTNEGDRPNCPLRTPSIRG